MSTGIEWTGETWNPVLGCDRVSAGCDGCYAIPQARVRAGNPHPKVAAAFEGLTHRANGRLDWTGQINQLSGRLGQPLRWRKPRRVFVNSMSDLFHDGVQDEFIAHVFAVMAATPHHTFQVLTKRHARMRSLLNDPEFRHQVYDVSAVHYDRQGRFDPFRYADPVMIPMSYAAPIGQRHDDSDWWPLSNVWMGVSVEDQNWADIRIPALLDTPAAMRFLSAEPLLGPIDLTRLAAGSRQQPHMVYDALGKRYGVPGHWQAESAARLDWVIAGGESGPGARPMHRDWARTLRDQCAAADVPFFFKQFGAWIPESMLLHSDSAPAAFLHADGQFRPLQNGRPIAPPMARGEAITVRRVGKKAAGRELDGREWSEFPHHVGVGT